MNLLEKVRWNHSFPWGSIINPNTGKEICISEKLVTFTPGGAVHFGCSKGDCSGWHSDPNGNPAGMKAGWSVGAIIAKEEYRTHFGAYQFKFRLPDFRGAWPAIWLIDLHPAYPKGDGMGMPPEIDVFEHFRKDSFFSRFSMTSTFHMGPTYEDNKQIFYKFWKLWPLDLNDIELIFSWTSKEMTWKINGKKVMTVPAGTLNYPTRPMNLIINSGLGLDWSPNTGKFEDFIVHQASYTATT